MLQNIVFQILITHKDISHDLLVNYLEIMYIHGTLAMGQKPFIFSLSKLSPSSQEFPLDCYLQASTDLVVFRSPAEREKRNAVKKIYTVRLSGELIFYP